MLGLALRKANPMTARTCSLRDVWFTMFAVSPKGPKQVEQKHNAETMPPKKILAVETRELPILVADVVKTTVHLLHIADTQYFLDSVTKKLYTVVDGRPGSLYGVWDAETKTIQEVDG